MAAPVKPINLLPTTDFEISFWGKFLRWAVTSGRYIIIATELVVILAFLSRFKLDQDLADINETIKGQESLLTRQKPLEDEFRFTQSRLDSAQLMMTSQFGIQQRTEKIVSNMPPEVKMVSIQMLPNEVTLQAVTLSEQAIGELLARLVKEPMWRELEMTNFSTKNGSEINFTLVLRI